MRPQLSGGIRWADDVDAQLSISTLDAWPIEADELVTNALGENFRALLRLRNGWRDGSNRFVEHGEGLFAARLDRVLVGICGLNRDPFTIAEGVGRLRHLYVSPACRRRGVGSALVTDILAHAKAHFRTVRLRTDRTDANSFYLALGFRGTPGNPDATHDIDLSK
jgi:GNAT superfamily N-acetyltransferase